MEISRLAIGRPKLVPRAEVVAELNPLPDGILTDPGMARFDPRSWFDEPRAPFHVEIGSGKGTFLVQESQASCDRGERINYLGIEIARVYFEYAADRVRRHGLTNVRLINTDASEFIRWRVPDAIVDVIHVYFPDPWPKRRHHRRRLIQDEFLRQCRRVLVDRGEVRIVTDHVDYWKWIHDHIERWALTSIQTTTGAPGVMNRPDDAGGFERREFSHAASAGRGEMVGTNFERKYRREGRPFHSAVLIRTAR